jgi:N-methylhydantoinase A
MSHQSEEVHEALRDTSSKLVDNPSGRKHADCFARLLDLCKRGEAMSGPSYDIRVGADIGGTFTDVVLDVRGDLFSAKLLTDHRSPEQAIFDGMNIVLREAGLAIGDIDLLIHGTTLATNALIERRGARTAFITTAGFRDVIEMRTESRFAQYDINLVLPSPLVPREDRFPVGGRIDAGGSELQPLDEAAIDNIAQQIAKGCFGAIAVGFLHSYVNPVHERRARELLAARLDLPISISSDVSPQMREFERFNTVCANAYVRPLMADYLLRLQARLREMGGLCPVFLIHSGGGLVSVETAAEFPVRLVESGPAGGAIFAADIARRFDLGQVVSYDMGGTTAKICLIEQFAPRTARTFEVARTYRFAKGSGIPISVPVIEMIEIGAGGGSIASVDALGRIQTGPESAGSEPGPACYGRGGSRPTITDADLVLGKIDARNFAGGAIVLDVGAAEKAIHREVGTRLELKMEAAAFGISEVVDENMANAARVHAVENGKNISDNVMIAFGGAAPLHAARLCEKLGVARCLIPRGAGVGSAIGFLKAPFGFEAVASKLTRMSEFDAAGANVLLAHLRDTAERFVRSGSTGTLHKEITAFMRYSGQGWEIPVLLPERAFGPDDATFVVDAFRECYAKFFGRPIDGLDGLEIEIVTWSVKVQDARPPTTRQELLPGGRVVESAAKRRIFDPASGMMLVSSVFSREDLAANDRIRGPAVIVESETATIVSSLFDAVMQSEGSILLVAKESRP